MSEQTIDLGKRRFLTAATSVVGAVGVGFAATPFLASWMPSQRAKAAGAPVNIDISKLESGQMIRALWRKKPIWVFRRSPEEIANLAKLDDRLVDPNNTVTSQQPEYANNATRSIKPEIAVLIGICTHLGCSPTYRPEVGAADLGGDSWLGGFYCPCHGSLYDLSGRVFKNVPAPKNLPIPPHHYVTDDLLNIGVDPKA